MVGAHRNGDFAALLQFEEGFHYVIHVDVAFQVVGFVEVAFRIALCAAEVNEVDTVAELFHQGGAVVCAAYTQGTGAQTQAVALVGNSIDQSLEVGSTTHDTRQAKDLARRIVRVDNQLYAGFIGNRTDFTEEINQVGA